MLFSVDAYLDFYSRNIFSFTFTFTFTFMHLADAFIQSDLQCIQAIHFFISMCVSWEGFITLEGS